MEYTKCNICELPFDEKHNHETCVFKLNQEVTRLQSLTRWISVEEKLPDCDVDVLILVDGEVDTGFLFGEWVSKTRRDCDGCRETVYPTHWMPLPEGVK